jgi:hypothetical protein
MTSSGTSIADVHSPSGCAPDFQRQHDSSTTGWSRLGSPQALKEISMGDMAAGTELEIVDGAITREEQVFVVTLKLRNHSDRTLYAYSSPRKIQYDADTSRVRLVLHDEEANPIVESHLRRPHLLELEPESETEMRIELPPQIARLRAASETKKGRPEVEQIPVEEATSVDIELAYAANPFYYSSAEETMGEQLRRWTDGQLRATVQTKPPRRSGKRRRRSE